MNKIFFKKLIVFICLFLLLFSNVATYATYVSEDSEYVWSTSTVETASESSNDSSESENDFLDLTCESAILIEQNTRNNFV
jgi:hypothetical protein